MNTETKLDMLWLLLIGVWLRWREVGHDAREVVRVYGDVGVVDEEKFVPRLRSELNERAHLAVGAEARWALYESDRLIGKFALQLANGRNGEIIKRRDTEEKFEFAEIVLVAVRAKRIEHVGIEALQRFENGDARREGRKWRSTGREKHARGDDGEEEVRYSCYGQDRGQRFNGQGECVGVHES